MTISKAHYWILNALLEAGCTIRLMHPDDVQQYFNPPPSLNLRDLTDALDQLFQCGYVIAERDDEIAEGAQAQFVPNRIEIEEMLRKKENDVSLWLTPSGGEQWEELSFPDWNRYISNHWADGEFGDDEWGVAATDRSLIEGYLSSQDMQGHIVPGTIQWHIVRPWQTTYWKTLPWAHRVRFNNIQCVVKLSPEEAQCWEDPNQAAEPMPWARPIGDWYQNYFLS